MREKEGERERERERVWYIHRRGASEENKRKCMWEVNSEHLLNVTTTDNNNHNHNHNHNP